MVKFAVQCLRKLEALIAEGDMLRKFGPGTADLGMRVGIHSGPVTAGILKGFKSRFQIYGDTVNTSSRMESNGLRGKIQVSETTAKLLIAADKASWLKKRDTLVAAKGKGDMQTYWVHDSSSPHN